MSSSSTTTGKHRVSMPNLEYVQDMEGRRSKIKKESFASFSSALQRSDDDDDVTGETTLFQAANYEAYSRHVVDAMYPSPELTGQVMSFGQNDCNQLGHQKVIDEEYVNSCHGYEPTFIPETNLPSDVKMVVAGGLSSFAITYTGDAYSWGVTDEGQLGRNVEEDKEGDLLLTIGQVPIQGVIQIAAGNTHTVFLDKDGQVHVAGMYKTDNRKCWCDANTLGEVKKDKKNMLPYHLTTFPQKVIMVAAGNSFSAALLQDGYSLFTWGLGRDGQLARSRSAGAPPKGENEKGVSVGGQQRVYDYDVPMLGRNNSSGEFEPELDKVFKNFLTPKPVDWDADLKGRRRILSFACGDDHLLVVARDDGSFETRVYSAGCGATGQLGLGDENDCHYLTPITSLDNMRICKVSAGSKHSLALNMLGDQVWTWGNSNYGALGLGQDLQLKYVLEPRQIPFPRSIRGERIIDVVAGDNTNFAITNRHNLYAWGYNEYGQAGVYSKRLDTLHQPHKIDYMEKTKRKKPEAGKSWVLQASIGGQHSLLLVKRFKGTQEEEGTPEQK